MKTSQHVGNKILDRLPLLDFDRIIPQMERVAPEVGEVVAYPDKEPRFVHFPISGVLSSMVVLEDGSMIEASTIGNEGMDGLYLLADPLANPYRVNVQVHGEMLRMPAKVFERVLSENRSA
jgi:hypothetical protein